MKIQTVNVQVGNRQRPEDQGFTLAVYHFGPLAALPVSEIPVLQAMNGMDSVSMLSVCGEIETSKQDEWERIRAKYPEHYQLAYPSPAVPMPKELGDLDLDQNQIDAKPYRDIPKEDLSASGPVMRGQTLAIETEQLPSDKAELRKLLAELNVTVPFGNWSVARLQAMLLDARKTKAVA